MMPKLKRNTSAVLMVLGAVATGAPAVILENPVFAATTAPAISSAVAGPGTVAGTTKITLPSATVGSYVYSYVYQVVYTPTATPDTGITPPTGAVSYSSGSNIGGVDATTSKYVDIYELDGNRNIVKFKEVVLTGNNIRAPQLTTAPTAAPGTTAGSTKLTLTPNKAGDSFKVQVSNRPFSTLLFVGASAPGKAYTLGHDVSGVDSTKNKYVDIYEVDGSGKVVAFTELTLTSDQITAPTISSATAAPGTAAGTTKVTLPKLTTTSSVASYVYQVVSSQTAVPITGTTPPSGSSTYTSGNNISGVDATTNKYVDVYGLDANGKIVEFKEVSLVNVSARGVVTGTAIRAPQLTTAPIATPGGTAGSTKLTLTADATGDTFKVQVGTKALTTLPAVGGSASGKAYTSGSLLSGVDAAKSKFADIYEIAGTGEFSGKVVAFTELNLDSNQVTAPTISGLTAAPGTAAGTTKVTLPRLTTSSSVASYVYEVVSSQTAVPITGTTPPSGSSTYASGNNISGVDATTNKYVDVYGLDANGKIIEFKEVSLVNVSRGVVTGTAIRAPQLATAPIAAPGATAGSTNLTLTANTAGDTFKVQVGTKALTTLPAVGGSASGKAYTSGSTLSGVDAAKSKFADIYEIGGTGEFSGKVVAFTELNLASNQVTAPAISSVTAAPGTAAGTTKVTLPRLTTSSSVASYVYQVVYSPTAVPITGITPPSGTFTYSSGNNISGVDATTNKYVDVYGLDANGKIVDFKEVSLVKASTSGVVTGTAIRAPQLMTAPAAAPGTLAGSTILTLTANTTGDTFKVQVGTKALATLPVVGGSASGKAYTSGTTLSGVDVNKYKYVDIYEVNGSGKVVAFSELTLSSNQVTAPTITGATISAGSASQTTKVTIPVSLSVASYVYQVVSSPTTIPVTGTTPPTGTFTYTSASNIAGVDVTTKKYVDIYALDASGKIVDFKEFTVQSLNIKK